MEESARTEDCGRMVPCTLHLGGLCYNTVVKEEPEEILPTPRDESVHSEDCCGIPNFKLHLEGKMHKTFAMKEELDDVSTGSSFEGSHHEDSHCVSSCHDHLVPDEMSSVVVKEEPADSPGSEGEGEGESSGREDLDRHLSFQEPRECRQKGIPLSQEGSKYQCRFCAYSSSVKFCVIRHERTHTGERPFACGVCRQMFTVESHLRDHERIHTGERPFRCGVCQKTFRQKAHLRNHKRTHKDWAKTDLGDQEGSLDGENDLPPQEDCPETQLQKTDKRRDRRQCCLYPYSSFSATHVATHKKAHMGEKPYRCETCRRAYLDKGSFADHKRIHSCGKPYKCQTCHREFAARDRLASHMRTHTGEKPFKCSTCTSAFGHKANLKRHERTHTGQRPYACEICGSAFTRSSDLGRHRKSHT